MEIKETVIKTEKLLSGNIFDVKRDTVILPNGNEATRDNVEHMGACAILAIDEYDNVILVKQFRCSIYDVTDEIPAGKLEKVEDPDVAALRELEEETGYTSRNIIPYMKFYPDIGLGNQLIYVYLAKDLVKTCQDLDDDEFINVYKINIKELKQKIFEGKITDSKIIVPFLKYCLENNI